jgi:hypothetical protein
MSGFGPKLILTALAVAAALAAPGSADARQRKTATDDTTGANLPLDDSGTPIIMKGYQPAKGRVVPRVSTPVTVPPPYASPRDLPPRQLLQAPPPPVYAAPAQPSFSDRVTNCIHSYPLNAGVGNNPTNQTAYMGQCANQ